MKLPKKYNDIVMLFEKDLSMKGWNIILKDGFTFLDGTRTEYVETKEELIDFLSMVKR
jgi:hypothetical protein